MALEKDLDVQLIAASRFAVPDGVDWVPDEGVSDAEAIVEFAGRACYETFDRPNPHTATNSAYLHHIIDVGHDALLEHATATMYIRGLSRAAGNELLRHRNFSFSQLSQRFVHEDESEVVVPALIAQDEELHRMFVRAADETRFIYDELLKSLEENLEGSRTRCCDARRRARPPARFCRTRRRPASWSPATIGRGASSSRRAPPNTPTARSGCSP